MEGITTRDGQLIDQSLTMLNHKRWTQWWWARIPGGGTTNRFWAVACVKMDSSEKRQDIVSEPLGVWERGLDKNLERYPLASW